MNRSEPTRGIQVNRDQETRLFEDMIQGKGTAHIFLIQAEAGMGKTALLKRFWEHCDKVNLLKARINLKQTLYTPIEIMGDLCKDLGIEHFPRYQERCEEYARAAGIHIDRATLIGTHLEASLGSQDADTRRLRRKGLTDAYFEDLVAFEKQTRQMIVLLFDTYEKAAPDVQEWIAGQFLNSVRPHRWLVVVVAGQSIPLLEIDWDDWCLQQNLSALNRDNIREYVQRLQLSLTDDTIELLYAITQGKPYDLVLNVNRYLEYRRSIHG